MSKIQDGIEHSLFHSRWVLAPMYIGLVIVMGMLVVRFGIEFWHAIPLAWAHTEGASHGADAAVMVLAALELVDLVLVANLILIIVFSGYENFVSKIDAAEGHKDRPSWMGTIDYAGLKLKIIGSVVAISAIHLLASFMKLSDPDTTDRQLAWKVGLHMTFVFSGVFFAIMEYIAVRAESSHAGGSAKTAPAEGEQEKPHQH